MHDARRLCQIDLLVEVHPLGCFGVPCLLVDEAVQPIIDFNVREEELLCFKHVLAINHEIDEPLRVLSVVFAPLNFLCIFFFCDLLVLELHLLLVFG